VCTAGSMKDDSELSFAAIEPEHRKPSEQDMDLARLGFAHPSHDRRNVYVLLAVHAHTRPQRPLLRASGGFQLDCLADVEGSVHGEPLFTRPADGRPRRAGDWASHGLAAPFALHRKKGRIGTYQYSEALPAEAASLESLWLEAYLGDADTPVAVVRFAPPSLVQASTPERRVENSKRPGRARAKTLSVIAEPPHRSRPGLDDSHFFGPPGRRQDAWRTCEVVWPTRMIFV